MKTGLKDVHDYWKTDIIFGSNAESLHPMCSFALNPKGDMKNVCVSWSPQVKKKTMIF